MKLSEHEVRDPTTIKLGLSISKRSFMKHWISWTAGALGALAVVIGVAIFWWYTIQLSPMDKNTHQTVRVTIEDGFGQDDIAKLLHAKGLVHSSEGFNWYVRVHHSSGLLQAGVYTLSPAMSLEEIVNRLTDGKTDTSIITFYPGATLVDNTPTAADKKLDVTSILLRAGYKQSEITAALNKHYYSQLFQGKPKGTSLEGYVYGDTYYFSASATVEEILQRTFDEFYGVVQENNLVAAYKSHGLSLYQGITLASIVEREVSTPSDQTKVAGVFYNRMKQGINLGSDVTYQYIADKTGRDRDPSLDSPYNTRKYPGLPPGPIGAPGKSALVAIAHPAKTEYLFFLSGDDGKTYFARTQTEHDANIANHCKEKCKII